MRFGIVLVVLALASAPSSGADFDSGQAAFDAGRFDEALADWRAAADAGDLRAMLVLGRVHVRGVGAPQNYVEAHMWLNLAAGRGDAAAAEERDALAGKMTAEQVASAQERAARWLPEAARVPAIGVGDVFRDCPHCPEMVVVPAGSFTMGSPASEEGRFDDEGPVHRVRIRSPFAVGVHEVTRGEFGRFVSATGRSMGYSCGIWENGEWKDHSVPPGSVLPGWRNPGFRQADSHPAVCVSWNDAQAYVSWLSGETGEWYRLLSESEWEYVARAGTSTSRYWGDSSSSQCRYANGRDASAGRDWGVDCDDGYSWTSPVGSFGSNRFGLHDVLGNVWESTQDCWKNGYAGASGDGSAWERGDCSHRVLRGGSWFDPPKSLRAAFRNSIGPGLRRPYAGFRVARTFTP